MADLAAEESDAGYLAEMAKPPEETEIPEGCEVFFRAFRDLRDDRQYGDGGGAGSIYFSSITEWARQFGVGDADFATLYTVLRAMDTEYMKFMAEEAKKALDKERNK